MATNIEYNGIYISMDGCIPCIKCHNDTEKIISQYVKYHKSINVDHLDQYSKEDQDLVNAAKVRACPQFLIFRKIDKKNVYIGRIIGYNNDKMFLESIDKIKKNWETNNTTLVIRLKD